jgi:hypothetical protein
MIFTRIETTTFPVASRAKSAFTADATTVGRKRRCYLRVWKELRKGILRDQHCNESD